MPPASSKETPPTEKSKSESYNETFRLVCAVMTGQGEATKKLSEDDIAIYQEAAAELVAELSARITGSVATLRK